MRNRQAYRVTSGAELRQIVGTSKNLGSRVGLVPTMGALHEGHASLVKLARKECDRVVATIFVNPAQFGPSEDFDRYPRTLEADLSMLGDAGADIVFTPAVEEIYPADFSTCVDPPSVSRTLEGKFRPDHFRGVCTVVLKLFHFAPANIAYFGQKDYQQSLVVRRMTEDLNVPIEIRVAPTVREASGLAMSSRNRYLSKDERKRAAGISSALSNCRRSFQSGERRTATLAAEVVAELKAAGIEAIDYVAIVDRETLAEAPTAGPGSIALVAVRIGGVRLIDNVEFA